MNVLLKWNPEYESDTLQRRMEVASAKGAVWWGCHSTDPFRRVADERIARLKRQLQVPEVVWAFLYRVGAPATRAEVSRARIIDVTDRPEEVEVCLLPRDASLSESFLWFKLNEFQPMPRSWVLSNLERWDELGRSLDQGSLRNQTSPLYVAIRGG